MVIAASLDIAADIFDQIAVLVRPVALVVALHGPEHAELVPVGKVRVFDFKQGLNYKVTPDGNKSRHGSPPPLRDLGELIRLNKV